MPIYEYSCNACQHEFEALVFGRDKAECPKCHGKKLTPKLSMFAMAGKSPSNSMSEASVACGSCGDPRGPGACSLGDMD